jgi:hypothetical protein
VLPGAFLFQASEEPLNQAVLLRRVRRNVFLRKPVDVTGSPETTALKNQAVIASDCRHLPLRPHGSETVQASAFQSYFRFFGPPPA